MDIRNFFHPKGGTTQKQRKALHADDDEDDFVKKSTKKKKIKGIIFESDSSDEDPMPKKVKKRLKSADIIPTSDDEYASKKSKPKASNLTKKKGQKIAEPKMKEISPDTFFGSCSKTVKKEKRLAKRKASDDHDIQKAPEEVITIDDDDELDFDGSLAMTPQKKIKREVKIEKPGKALSSKVSDIAKKSKSLKSTDNSSAKAEKQPVPIPKGNDKVQECPSTTPEKSSKKFITIDDDDEVDFDGSLAITPKTKTKREVKVEKAGKTLASKVPDIAKKSKSGKSTENSSAKAEKKLDSIPVVKDKVQEHPLLTPEKLITIDDDDELDFDGSLAMTPGTTMKSEVKVEKAGKTLSSKVSDLAKKSKSGKSTDSSSAKAEKKLESIPVVKDEVQERPLTTPEKAAKKPKESADKKPTSEHKVKRSASSHSSRDVIESTPKDSKKIVSPLVEKKSNTPQKIMPEKAKKNEEGSTDSTSKQQKYLKYMHWQSRGGAKAPGSKEIPQGASNCLEGLTFVISGILESLERDEAKSLIERYGGKVTGSVSGRTSYFIVGDDPGESKIKKAEQHKTKQIDEDGLLELIKTKPGKKSKYEVAAEKERKTESKAVTKEKIKTPEKDPESLGERSATTKKVLSSSGFYGKKNETESSIAEASDAGDTQESVTSLPDSQKLVASSHPDTEYMLWVDKYKPKTLKQIIGQQGPKSNVVKLKTWLLDWHKNNRPHDGSKPKPKPKVNMWGGGGDPTGAGFKAALLSGPPGIGKTTAATLLCQELGFQYIEMNASDTRSKRTLKEEISQMLDNTSIASMFGTKDQKKTAMEGTKNALIMDEIDGMAGNEDRGGMQEVIQLIKTTKMPIICMCNDRSSPKIRSLTNHCFDLRFQRPRVEQITGAMMSVCFKEGIKIQPPALQALIRGCNQDIRQVLYNLRMMKASNNTVSYDEAKKQGGEAHKDVAMGIFDIARKLLTSESASLSLNDKLSLFFMDYSMMPLFVQDNYPHIRTASAAGNIHKQLSALSRTADSIALADQLDKVMRRDQSWGALPTLGLLSTVLPCDIMRGGMSGMINFPSFFGKLSTTGKNRRLLQELKFHSSLTTEGANEDTFNMDYLPFLRWHLTRPLIEQSRTGETEVHKTSALLDAYDFLREDFDSIIDIGQYPGKSQPMSKVDSKVKSAFTRTFNKESHLTPYAVQTVAKKSKKVAVDDINYGLEEGESQVTEEEEEDGMDAMVKAKPARKNNSAASSSKTKKTTSDKNKGKRGKKK